MAKRLSHLTVENFKKLTLVEIPINGVTEISGKNAVGKSSVIDAIGVWLDGLKVAPTEPIHDGATRSRIKGRLGEMYVIRYIEPSKGGRYTTRIQFEPVDGKAYPATQKQLDDLIGEHCLDPLDFLKLDSKGLFAAFQSFVPGFDFAKAAQEDAADYARRTEVNRIAKESRAAANLIVVPDGTPEDPIDEAALVQRLQEAGDENARTERRRLNREAAGRKAKELRASAAQAEERLAQALARIESDGQSRLDDLQRQIDVLLKRRDEVRESIVSTSAQATAASEKEASAQIAEAEALENQIKAAGDLPTIVDTAELTKQITAARTTNEAVRRAQERRKHNATAKKYEDESTQLTEAMQARAVAKRNAIAEAKIPIQGLDFGDGEVRLNGQLFEQASTAQKLRVALAYTVMRNPELRLAWIRDASLLDDESYAEVERLAREFDCDVLLETVRPIGSNVVVLEDGRVKKEETQTEVAA